MPIITSAPKPHSMIQLEAVRQELAEAAELATGATGHIDAKMIPAHLRDAFDKISGFGGSTGLSAASFAQKLDHAMDALDRADTGGAGDGHYFGYQGTTGIEDRAAKRRAETVSTTPLFTRLMNRLSGGNNFTLDVEERKAVAGQPAAMAVLAKADDTSAAKSEALAKKHFTGTQALHRDYTYHSDPQRPLVRDEVRAHGHFGGGAGALTDIATVMVKHQRSGEWSSAKVNDDGSFKVMLGDKAGELSIWYETKSGEKFLGGNVLMFSNTHDDKLSFSVLNGLPRDMEKMPLHFAK